MYQGERFNSITHLLATVAALIGSAVAITIAVMRTNARTVTAVAIYGSMLVLLYLSSTLYHSLRGRAKRIFHVFDHTTIYLLIAGTYTPFTLVTLRGAWGWSLFAAVWTLAALGVAKDIFLHGRMRAISLSLYVIMGWLVAIAITPLRRAMPMSGILWIAAGGLVYMIGIIFYALSNRVVHAHGVWHLFVIGGSVCHYIAIVRYVVYAQ
jgi:hemolysin III